MTDNFDAQRLVLFGCKQFDTKKVSLKLGRRATQGEGDNGEMAVSLFLFFVFRSLPAREHPLAGVQSHFESRGEEQEKAGRRPA